MEFSSAAVSLWLISSIQMHIKGIDIQKLYKIWRGVKCGSKGNIDARSCESAYEPRCTEQQERFRTQRRPEHPHHVSSFLELL